MNVFDLEGFKSEGSNSVGARKEYEISLTCCQKLKIFLMDLASRYCCIKKFNGQNKELMRLWNVGKVKIIRDYDILN